MVHCWAVSVSWILPDVSFLLGVLLLLLPKQTFPFLLYSSSSFLPILFCLPTYWCPNLKATSCIFPVQNPVQLTQAPWGAHLKSACAFPVRMSTSIAVFTCYWSENTNQETHAHVKRNEKEVSRGKGSSRGNVRPKRHTEHKDVHTSDHSSSTLPKLTASQSRKPKLWR